MQSQIRELEDNKIYLLKINENYVKVVNQYYSDLNNRSGLYECSNDMVGSEFH